MKTEQRRRDHLVLNLVLLIALTAGAGCATNGRQVLLREYRSTVSSLEDESLKGKVVCVKRFECAQVLNEGEITSQPDAVEPFEFQVLSEEDSREWAREWKVLKQRTTPDDWWKVGRLRNTFGMVMSSVYALNDPGEWLAETLRMDLQAQGAEVVDASREGEADITVSGTIRFCSVDIYMKIWADLVVQVEYGVKGREPQLKTLHTAGGTVAWVGSKTEFYKPLRECRQKLSLLVIRDLAGL